MNRNFNFEMANGFRGTMNNVNEIAQLVKAELLNTNNAVFVNGFRFRIGRVDGYDGYALYVGTNDDNPNPCYRKWYVHKIYHLGKIRRGIDKYVADFLTKYAEYGWDTPIYVWRDGKMVDIDDMEENNMNDMTGIDENGFAIDGLVDVNENMRVVDVDMIKDCIEECVEDLCLAEDGKRMDFEGFCDVLWTNYVWDRVLDSGCTDESLEIETRYVMEFNDRVRYIVEHDFDMLYINCYDEIGVDDMVKNSSPCLDDVDIELANDRLADWLVKRANGTMGDYFTDVTENMWDYSRDDIDEDRLREILLENVDGLVDVEFTEPDDDRNIVRIWFDRPIKKKRQDSAKVAKVIKDYVDNYEGMLMDYNGYGASICVPWDVFNEDDMKMLIEDDEFEAYVDQYLMKTNIYDVLVYDDGVYVSVDADMFDRVA